MRRAITFFIIATLLFLISEGLLVLTGGGSELSAGIFSIFVALFYVVFPVFSTRTLALLPNIPLGILFLLLSIGSFAVVFLVCAVEFLMPVAIGYVVIEMIGRQFQTTGVIVTSICFITGWLLLRKHQWRLIQESWEAGFKVSSWLIEPIEKLMGKIWKGAEKIGEAIRA